MTPTAPSRRPGRAARRASLVVATTASLALVLSTLAGAGPASAADAPSWADVEAARGDAAATQAQVVAVTAALDGLERTAAARG
ncbi:hypothetical protein IFT72_06720, partial [Frigoribacterium sp. CFBP 8754]|nr:hypothetical protein [Frigoribacterium sp. CFBP 8754]